MTMIKGAITLTEKEQKARKMVCLPLDGLATMDDLKSRVKELSPVVGLFKVGKETFTRFGPDAVKAVQEYGANVFLDLKYHDIPNTVRGAADAATSLGVYMFNVHASGGLRMMQAAEEGARLGSEKYGVEKPKIVAVTVLTSLDEAAYLQTFQPLNSSLREIDFNKYLDMEKDDETLQNEFRRFLVTRGLTGIIQKQVLHLANLTNQAGLDGIVCSAADLNAVKNKLPDGFIYVNPGIKGPNTPAGDDQKRVFTPGNAVQDGSGILVIGRAITGPKTSEERIQAGYEILKDMAKYIPSIF